mmetsp:Transcript_553/g.1336  ORF Transcript_553/g.1336 Transcript_553/m.1336 type:complete len:328 (+) Transcript_553:31-1014(+)
MVRSAPSDDGCCDDESDYCVGVTLQTVLIFLVSGCLFTFYGLIIPTWFAGSTAGIVNSIAFAVLMVLTVSSYLQTWLTDPGSVPDRWVPEEILGDHGQIDEAARRAAIESGAVRFCKKCQMYRPPRSHHCASCKKCVLRMDHHCPWVQNCVGAGNTKFFILFLFYATISCVYYSAMVFFFLLSFFKGKTALSVKELGAWLGIILATVIIVFCLSLMVAGLCGWNLWLLAKNETSLENYDNEVAASRGKRAKRRLEKGLACTESELEAAKTKKPARHPYNLGLYRNIKSVMGPSWWLWMVPVHPVGPMMAFERHSTEMELLHGEGSAV